MKIASFLNSRSEKVYVEMIRILLVRSRRAVIINLAISFFIFIFFFRISRHSVITYWILAQFILSIIRLLTIKYFLLPDKKLTSLNARKYETYSVIYTTIAGIIAGSIIFFPIPDSHQLHFFTFVSFILGGMVAGSSTILSASIPSLVSYTVMVLSPVTIKFLSLNEGLFHMLALFIIMFGATLVIIGIENGKNLKHDLNNKYFNKKLFQDILDGKKQLEKVNNFLEGIMNNSSNALFVLDVNGRFFHVNPSLCRITGLDQSLLLEKNFLDILHPEDTKNIEKDISNVLSGQITIRHSEARVIGSGNKEIYINFSLSSLKNGKKGKITGAVGTAENITDIKLSQIFQSGRSLVLELLAENASLETVFHQIIRTTQKIYSDSMASILLLDEHNLTVKSALAPSLPDFYNQSIIDVKIGPDVGSCGAAMFTGEMVVAEDIMVHPNWKSLRKISKKAGIRACWSEPIKGREGRILGSFAVYYKIPKSPSNHEISLIKELASIVQIAIEKKEMEKELAKKNDELDFLHQISSSANQAKELNQFYENITDAIKKLEKIGLENSVRIFEKENDYLKLVFSTETEVEHDFCKKIQIGQCLCGLSAKNNELIISENGTRDPRHTIKNPEDKPAHGHVVIPIKVKNEITGVLCLFSRDKEFKDLDDYRQMFLTAGNHIGEAISRNKLYDEVKELALKDSLTGLANRRKMAEFIDHIFATTVRFEYDLSVIMFDIDHFKEFNDNYGHAKGDMILKKIGMLLLKEGRQSDLHIRYGGEEFLVILPQTSLKTALNFAERIRKSILNNIGVTVSMGVSELNVVDSFEDLLKRVDKALYLAKEKGRNCTEIG